MKKTLLITSLIIASTTSISAQDNSTKENGPSFYISGSIGQNSMDLEMEQENRAIVNGNVWENTMYNFYNQEDGASISTALGVSLTPVFRAEIELLHQESKGIDANLISTRNGINSGVMINEPNEIKHTSIMTNTYLTLPTKYISPYIGLGLGATFATMEDGNKNTFFGLGYQLMLGAEFSLTKKVTLGIEGRFFGSSLKTKDVELGIMTGELTSDSVAVKLRYNF